MDVLVMSEKYSKFLQMVPQDMKKKFSLGLLDLLLETKKGHLVQPSDARQIMDWISMDQILDENNLLFVLKLLNEIDQKKLLKSVGKLFGESEVGGQLSSLLTG